MIKLTLLLFFINLISTNSLLADSYTLAEIPEFNSRLELLKFIVTHPYFWTAFVVMTVIPAILFPTKRKKLKKRKTKEESAHLAKALSQDFQVESESQIETQTSPMEAHVSAPQASTVSSSRIRVNPPVALPKPVQSSHDMATLSPVQDQPLIIKENIADHTLDELKQIIKILSEANAVSLNSDITSKIKFIQSEIERRLSPLQQDQPVQKSANNSPFSSFE